MYRTVPFSAHRSTVMGEGENLTNIVKNKEKGEILFLLILLEHIYIERVELDTFLLYVQYDESYSIAAPGLAGVRQFGSCGGGTRRRPGCFP